MVLVFEIWLGVGECRDPPLPLVAPPIHHSLPDGDGSSRQGSPLCWHEGKNEEKQAWEPGWPLPHPQYCWAETVLQP